MDLYKKVKCVRAAQATAGQSKLINIVKTYISQNYRHNITLNARRNIVHLKLPATSDLFKKEAG